MIERQLDVAGRDDALQQQWAVPLRSEMLDVLPRDGRIDATPEHLAELDELARGRGGRAVQVAVRRAWPLDEPAEPADPPGCVGNRGEGQLRRGRVAVADVALAQARDLGVNGDGETGEAGRLGALDELLADGAIGAD